MPANRPKPRRRFPPEVLTHDEVLRLMDACGSWRPTAIRDRALLALLYRCGLRINEALALYPKDIDLAQGSVRVLHGKGNRSRTVGIDSGAADVIVRWLECRASLGFGGPRPVFCTRTGVAMTSSYVRVLLPKLARRKSRLHLIDDVLDELVDAPAGSDIGQHFLDRFIAERREWKPLTYKTARATRHR